jgi:hypothetical protein
MPTPPESNCLDSAIGRRPARAAAAAAPAPCAPARAPPAAPALRCALWPGSITRGSGTMALPALGGAEVDTLLAEFEQNGFIVVPLLSRAEVQSLLEAFDADRRAFPDLWTLRGTDSRGGPTGESGRWQSGEVLRTSAAAFAPVVSHPRVLQLAAALIGPAARHGNCSAMWREPVPRPPPPTVPDVYARRNIHWQLWHREAGGTTSPDHPRVIPSLQMIVYLDACDSDSHCFSVVKESVEEKRALPTEVVDGRLRVLRSSPTGAEGMWTNRPLAGRPGWEGRQQTGTDIHAPAGTIVIQNNLNLHAGTVRTCALGSTRNYTRYARKHAYTGIHQRPLAHMLRCVSSPLDPCRAAGY